MSSPSCALEHPDVVDLEVDARRPMVSMPRSATASAPAAEQHRRDVRHDLVDQSGLEEGGRQGRSALEEHVLTVAGEQGREHLVRVAGAQLERLGPIVEDPAVRREAALTHDDAQRLPGERLVELVADGQLGVVDLDGVGADQHRVALGPQPVGVASRGAGWRPSGCVPSAAALRPSRVVANFQVTNGRPCSTRERSRRG